MLENFRVALRKQRKLIVIFLVTVFIPALSLGIFGIRAIRNERFRQARQIENEQRRIAERLRSHVSAELRELELPLQNVADSPAFQAADEKAVAGLAGAISNVIISCQKDMRHGNGSRNILTHKCRCKRLLIKARAFLRLFARISCLT